MGLKPGIKKSLWYHTWIGGSQVLGSPYATTQDLHCWKEAKIKSQQPEFNPGIITKKNKHLSHMLNACPNLGFYSKVLTRSSNYHFIHQPFLNSRQKLLLVMRTQISHLFIIFFDIVVTLLFSQHVPFNFLWPVNFSKDCWSYFVLFLNFITHIRWINVMYFTYTDAVA